MTVQLNLDSTRKGSFFIDIDGTRAAEMVVGVDHENVTVFHTEVSSALKGQNARTQLLEAMAGYAREHHLKVDSSLPFCRRTIQTASGKIR